MTLNFTPREIALALGGEISGKAVLAPGPNHSAKDRSLSVKVDPTAPGGFVVHSFAGDDAITCKDYVRGKLGVRWEPQKNNGADPIGRMQERVSTQPAEYVYQLEDGTPYLRVKRTASKDFYQQHWKDGGWVNGAPKGERVPYRLPELLEAEHETVLIVEGEKDADNLAALGLMVTTSSGGAEKWTADLNRHFKGRDVYILPDNDDPGERHAKQVSESLAGIAREIRIVRLPGLPPKGDVSDWIRAGGTVDELATLMDAAPKLDQPPTPENLILSSGDLVSTFIPPDYAIDGLVQRRFCYSLTAPTGHGKTAVALLISACKAQGLPLGKHEMDAGRVLYFAGENPDDVTMRWIALADKMEFDAQTIDVHFLKGTKKLSEIGPRIGEEVQRLGGVSLIIVDTSAAYFEGDEENGNVQAGAHARLMRSMVTLPGEPCVLVMCHPVKNATQDNLLPRGGGAFLAEVDGNLTCWKTDSLVNLHWLGKFRGPDFAPISFQLETATSCRLRDTKGRMIPTVFAKPLSERERCEAEASSRSDEDMLLVAIFENERASMANLATVLQWLTKENKPYKARVQRSSDRLKKGGYVKMERGSLVLTDKGKKEANRVKTNQTLAGAVY